ncbi:helix-turn-helix transcriptional regulator [Haloarchaeobius litoreus]|uniref:Helix-turn-helix transcriptional regulator n=1 Tax=Haloarchaeobius litoreus TaxID=755306 RepID=A0ABD6DMY4_9EURY|nr:helix-turn-helix transcriptional regulator [Haloarchaeobius litoreus]
MSDNDSERTTEGHEQTDTDEAHERHLRTMGRSNPDRGDHTVSVEGCRRRPHGDTTWVELTGFQRDLLTCIRRLDDGTTIPTGTTIKEAMESLYGETINHGRLYQNLNHLAECDCIDKVVVDGRTNAYYLTDGAIEMLDETAKHLVSTCGLQQSITES